ncbi:MAG: alpha amylase C-terminal domain-containing protein [Acidobacteriaceae bacterium]|jgi:1,4-alpha-glucan branching enzyme
MISQKNCTPNTPMGANLVAEIGVAGGGATFRAWAPRATAVYVNGVFGGVARSGQDPALLLAKDANGYWSGFLAEAGEGDTYRFYVVGEGSSGYKRDPYARELANDPALPFPVCPAVIRAASRYPWHDAGFRTPDFSDMVVYQLHIGTYSPANPSQRVDGGPQVAATGWAGTFLDVVMKIEYLVALGVNVVQPLPVYEMEDSPSQGYPGLGYQGSDLYSPAIDYAVYHEKNPVPYLKTINRLLAAKGFAPITRTDLRPAYAQLKVMVDLLHVYGIAVMFDVVHNHAGGWGQTYTVPKTVDPSGVLHGDDYSLYFWDRAKTTGPDGNYDNNQSLYFTNQGFVGGLAYAMWNADVRGFLHNSSLYHVQELHADGFRYDEISMLLALNQASGWQFCREGTTAVRRANPRVLQNAEYWPAEYGAPAPLIVAPVAQGGLGCDAVQHDGLREAIRTAIGQAAAGAGAYVGISGIAMAMWPAGFAHAWQTIPCVENHDIVKLGEQPRIPALADGSDHRSWYARSRTRVAMALLLTAPGIPQLFMGQEFLEDKQWCPDPRTTAHLIWWGGLVEDAKGKAVDPAMADHLRFTQDAVRLRNLHPGLRGEGLNVFYTSDPDRVIAFQRWVAGQGNDVVVVATLSESTWWDYCIGFPSAGCWVEVFNSDAYDSCNANGVSVNPQVAGNAGGVNADGPPLHNLPASASIVIPANGVVVFVKRSS